MYRLLLNIVLLTIAFLVLVAASANNEKHGPHTEPEHGHHTNHGPLSPKVMIVTGFQPEHDIWLPYNFTQDIPVMGFLPMNQNVSCTSTGDVCVMTMGQCEIGNAIAMTLLWSSSLFDLTESYWLIAGIAGINPRHSTIGSVVLSKYVVEVEIGMAFAGSDLPANYSDQYFFAYFQDIPSSYPSIVGTEVYELNEALRDKVATLASKYSFNDNPTAASYRSRYEYRAARAYPGISKCDVASAQTYWSGKVYAENVEYYTNLVSNGTAVYCSTDEDDTGTMAGLFRGAMMKKVDFSRIVVMKGSSNFDRPPPGISAYENLLVVSQNGYESALINMFGVGSAFINDVVAEWETTYGPGINATNYVGDICGYLGGTPDFGYGHC
ncbi:purine nucleoside permease [Lipomyces starkeyi]